ncbi:MAG: agmatine deiminase family protein, partial [Paracoccaceae bacterium]
MKAGVATGLALAGGHAKASARFVVPAEEHPQDMAILQWPVSRTVYDDRYFLEMVQATIADIANAIAAFQPVVLLADGAFHDKIRKQVSAAVTLWDIPTEDLWARDSGP